MPQKKNKTAFHALWKFLISVKLTIILLIILAIACIIGTVIPQNVSDSEYLRLYSRSTYDLLKTAGCFDLYHAWWFIGLISAFTINLLACSFNRIPRVIKLISRSDTVLEEQRADNLMYVKKITFKTYTLEKQQKIAEAFERFMGNVKTVQENQNSHFFSEKGRFSHLSFYFTHIGFVTIIVGTLLGSLGYQGYIQLFEGETTNTVTLRKSYGLKELPFELRCDKFEVTFYDNKMPKDYQCTLTVLEKGREILTKTIEVNDPLIYKGIYFYQSSYGVGAGGHSEVLIGIEEKKTGKVKRYRVKTGHSFEIGGGKTRVKLSRVIPDFMLDESGRIVSRSAQANNPAALLTIYPYKGRPYTYWVFANYPSYQKKTDTPFQFSFLKLYPQYYTGLQVTRDPGVWIVWLGCILVIVGMYFAFFMSHRRLWLTIKQQNNGFKAILAGTSNKNKDIFTENLDTFFRQIKSIGES